MMRRRHKTPKAPKPAAHGHAPAPSGGPRSRRRAREGAYVPAELRIKPHHLAPPKTVRTAATARTPEEKPPRARPTQAPRKSEQVVLVTGFDAFGGESRNPSWDICNRLPREIAGLRVEICRVPCEFRRAIETVASAIEKHRPALVVCLGQAGGRAHMSVERVAINIDDARIADNGGAQPVDEAIAPNGPPAYFATLPVKAMAQAMRAAGVPTEVSNSAGTYVCNHLMYGVLHYLAASGVEARAGFIHVPYSEEQVLDKPAIPGMAIATMAKGVEAGIAAARATAQDPKVAGGTLD
jgi:pyroglutamyl-peptidase